MIFVTLGTQDKPFNRLLDAIQREIDNGNIKDEVIVQQGSTKYDSKDMKFLNLLPINEFDELVKSCDLLITHGGVGSILTGLYKGKKIIGAARLKEYGEVTNNHQLQLLGGFEEKGYILNLANFDDLGEVLKKVKKFKPKPFSSNNEVFINKLDDYIKSVIK